ncbi:MAG: hypothetical protein IT537_10175 [Hyphomicrobiales bacterium]|nr:hypothetical protein [Hyphomicrobiales bacterium]
MSAAPAAALQAKSCRAAVGKNRPQTFGQQWMEGGALYTNSISERVDYIVAVLRQFPYPATSTALDDNVVMSWYAEEFSTLMSRHPSIVESALRIVGARTHSSGFSS